MLQIQFKNPVFFKQLMPFCHVRPCTEESKMVLRQKKYNAFEKLLLSATEEKAQTSLSGILCKTTE